MWYAIMIGNNAKLMQLVRLQVCIFWVSKCVKWSTEGRTVSKLLFEYFMVITRVLTSASVQYWQTLLVSSSVNVAVLCLSLMGTNYQSYIEECNRVPKPGFVFFCMILTSLGGHCFPTQDLTCIVFSTVVGFW